MSAPIRTQTVRFTRGPLGLVHPDDPYSFTDRYVVEGDEGDLIVEGDVGFDLPDGYMAVKVGPLICPVDESMIESADASA